MCVGFFFFFFGLWGGGGVLKCWPARYSGSQIASINFLQITLVISAKKRIRWMYRMHTLCMAKFHTDLQGVRTYVRLTYN